MSTITVFNPLTGESSTVESNDAEQMHGVDSRGASVGQVPLGTAFLVTPEPPPGDGWLWNFDHEKWDYQPTLPEAIAQASIEVDCSAGAARLRYLTDVPGQQATYIIKATEAHAWIDGGSTSGVVAGPYLQAEAAAMQVDVTTAAQNIITIANQWDLHIGPNIERCRRAGKIAIAEATTNIDVVTQRDAAVNALNKI